MVSRRIEQETNERALGVLAITHYNRLLHVLRPGSRACPDPRPDRTDGRTGVASELERTGYADWETRRGRSEGDERNEYRAAWRPLR